jgi:hypothetical protein
MFSSSSPGKFLKFNFRRISAAASLWGLLALLAAGTIAGQRLDSSIGPQDSKALLSISRALALTSDATSASLFQSVGFPPGAPPPGWASFPIVRKIESAYLAAEHSRPGEGANVLALLAQSLAQQYDGVKYDPALKGYYAIPSPSRPTFATILGANDKPELAVQKAILAISRYTERGHMGGAAGILQYYFNLPPEVAYDILRSSATNEVALTRGFARVPLERRHARLELLVSDLDATFKDTATLERDLDPYRHAKSETTDTSVHGSFFQFDAA